MTTLFRKYRPQSFENLVGQDIIVQTLTNELKANSYAQSYLFYGPRGTGKTTTARLLAKAINCQGRQKGSFEPCDQCSSCQEIAAGRSVDVLEIDAASQTGVDNVRENIIENAQFKPTSAKHKIFIIDEVHMLSTSAFNALLKTLEEPPAHTVFILATTELHKLPATIVSRCQRFTFKKIPHDTMLKRLEKICAEEKLTVEPAVLERIIGKSDGCLRDAESLLGQVSTLTSNGTVTAASVDLVLPPSPFASVITLLEHLARKDAPAALSYVTNLAHEGLAVDYFLTEMLEAIRLILHLAVTKQAPSGARDTSPEERGRIDALAAALSPANLTRLLDITLKRRQDSKFSPIPELPLELIIAEYCFETTPAATPAAAPATTNRAPATPLPQPTPVKPTPSAPTSTRTKMPEPPITAPIAPPPPSAVSETNAQTFSVESVREQWKKIVEWVGSRSHSLTFILNTVQLSGVNDGRLTLTVPYDFHREKLSESKNKKLIEQALQEVVGISALITCETGAATAPSVNSDQSGLNDLAAAFGGEVVSS